MSELGEGHDHQDRMDYFAVWFLQSGRQPMNKKLITGVVKIDDTEHLVTFWDLKRGGTLYLEFADGRKPMSTRAASMDFASCNSWDLNDPEAISTPEKRTSLSLRKMSNKEAMSLHKRAFNREHDDAKPHASTT